MNNKKTPVSILQEMMVKKGTAPSYELIHNGGGTHQNIFTYQVTCEGLTASGTGRCKKDAKHEAATAMLETIAKHQALPQLPASPCESPVRTPLPMELPISPKSPANVPFRNAIGELQDLCLTNNLEGPVYKETGDVGPPHARVFTVQCTVSTFVEVGTATTKKLAKHEAARKMIIRIQAVVSDNQIDDFKDEPQKHQRKVEIASKIAIARYPELSEVHNEINRSKINWGLKVENFHKSLTEKFSEETRNNLLQTLHNLSESFEKCKNNFCEETFAQLKEEFKSTLESVDIQVYINEFECKKSNIVLLGIQLNTAPDIHEIGIGKTQTEAEVCAYLRVVQSLIFFLE